MDERWYERNGRWDKKLYESDDEMEMIWKDWKIKHKGWMLGWKMTCKRFKMIWKGWMARLKIGLKEFRTKWTRICRILLLNYNNLERLNLPPEWNTSAVVELKTKLNQQINRIMNPGCNLTKLFFSINTSEILRKLMLLKGKSTELNMKLN